MPSISSQIGSLIQLANHIQYRTRLAQQTADAIAVLRAEAFGEFVQRPPSPDILVSLTPAPRGTLEPSMRHHLLRKVSGRCIKAGVVTSEAVSITDLDFLFGIS